MAFRKFGFAIIPLFLCSCGGPLSLISYTIASGVAMNANQEDFAAKEREAYSEKCLPTHRKENPLVSGEKIEASGNLVKAYEYYTIASKIGYPDADIRLLRLKPKMTEEQLKEGDKNMRKYTTLHIKTCFIQGN